MKAAYGARSSVSSKCPSRSKRIERSKAIERNEVGLNRFEPRREQWISPI